VAPFPIIDLLVAGLELDATGAHVHQQEEESVQQLHGEVISLQLAPVPLLLGALRLPVAEEQQAAGLRGAKVEGDGAGLLGVPSDPGFWTCC
uniref:Uncharacterized protein n=1 Tax=Astyanax mexicanus TaxID=7994 RepID=A0A3B1J483_ASTMX